jgi:hypothetical protein
MLDLGQHGSFRMGLPNGLMGLIFELERLTPAYIRKWEHDKLEHEKVHGKEKIDGLRIFQKPMSDGGFGIIVVVKDPSVWEKQEKGGAYSFGFYSQKHKYEFGREWERIPTEMPNGETWMLSPTELPDRQEYEDYLQRCNLVVVQTLPSDEFRNLRIFK